GISYAIGVAAARRNNGRVVLFEGDGSFLMHIQELEMVQRHGLKLLFCIMNDGAYGAGIHKLRADGVAESGSVFGRTDLAAIAKGFGLRGATITDVKQIAPLFEAYAAQGLAEVWNIHVSDKVVSPSTRRRTGRGQGKMETALLERRIVHRVRARLPVERVVVAAIAAPRIERVDDVRELARELRDRPQQDALQRQHLLAVTVRLAVLPLLGRAVVHHPVEAELRVERGPEVGGEEAVAEQPARRVEDEEMELGLRDREAVRPRHLGEVADQKVDVLDVVDHAAVLVALAIVDRLLVLVELRGRDDLRRVAAVLAVHLAQRRDQLALRRELGAALRQAPINEVVEAGELAQADLAAELVEARDAALAVADDVERRHVDLGVEPRPQVEVLQELRVVLQREQAETLAAHAERPVGEPALAHLRRRLGAERVD